MAVPLEQFIKQLEDSGILPSETLKDFLPPKCEPKDAEELARELVRKKKLTKFQAEEVYRGKGKSLVLGNYTILDKIGAGGMGQVFKAEHRRMHRIVAVKMLPTSMMKNPAVVARFEREVTAAAKLNHPNIVTAFDADNANDIHLLIMEYVEGSDLAALVKKSGPLPVEQALNYILQTARGLEAAHAEGIVHRDIKPANLLLDKKGTVKILDMGLARLSDEADSVKQAELTNTGTIMGTVDYMAPEQALNTKTADARADIYSLGCSLFYLLTGKATYGGDTLMAKLLAHRDQPIPSIQAIRPEVPEPVEDVFNRMVAKRIEDRYQTMTEVIADLERLTQGQAPSINTQPSWGSFADFGLSNFLNDISLAQPTPAKRRQALLDKDWINRNKKRLLIGGGVLGVLLLVTGLVIRLTTKDGTLVVTVNEPDADVQVLSLEGKVEITRKGEKGPITISVVPGKHRLKVQKDGFALATKEFEIESKGKLSITAKLVPVENEIVEAKKPLAFEVPGFKKWMKVVTALPAEQQVEAVAKKLQELDPDFDGKVTPQFENGVVTGLQFGSDTMSDISPVRALTGLANLQCSGKKISDLSSLKGLKLSVLKITSTAVSDLSPLAGMPLRELQCDYSKVADLTALKGMPLTTLGFGVTQVSDLSPLKGMPLTRLSCYATQVSDLTPLKNMQLTMLECLGTNVKDLSPLKGMPLTYLYCQNNPKISDLSPLKGMPLKLLFCDFRPERDTELLRSLTTLEKINLKSAAEFWKEVEVKEMKPLAFETPGFDQWVKKVAEMPADKQVAAVVKKLVELNPGFDEKVTPKIDFLDVAELEFVTDNVTDISPVRALLKLKTLNCSGINPGKCRLSDLSPLKGMLLTGIVFHATQVSDLSLLKGMPLTTIGCQSTKVADLSPLKGMLLASLVCGYTQVTDLSPLKGMPLTNLGCEYTPVSDLSPLMGMPLSSLNCTGTQVSDLSPLKAMPLMFLRCGSTLIADLSPIEECPLIELVCDFKPFRDTELLHSIKTLVTINKPVADFWREVEAKQAAFEAWTKQVATMPAEEQVSAVAKEMQELNPGFDGKVTPTIEGGVITGLVFLTDNVTDISPVRALPKLKLLTCGGSGAGQGKLADLSPLKGMSLTALHVWATEVSDLSPLHGMPLTHVDMWNTPVSDLTPLKDMKLTILQCGITRIDDLSPILGMPLTHFNCQGTRITDLSPLRDMPLKMLTLDFKPERDAELLRSIKTLESINQKPVAEFWKEVGEKQTGKKP